ncbi:4-(cytidine 5'-diphospho)-2-C-methyl-D-erythritol kinase [Leptospira sp. 'Mane']|uniref:4-(cytidine 5'-diphospho)-2-C-methyl-D-erythritol kinase n=1 Tax=Leptospira sp. 'Mane' TaxID=3387407 RepID=UPI00398A9CBC
MTTISPAKLNLGLEIPFKREDGYHEIRSIFLKTDFGDDFEAETFPLQDSQKPEFQLISKNQLPKAKQALFENVSERGDLTKNILYKTYIKIFPYLKNPVGIKVHLTKRIPPEGGVGGGSSNAGSLLKFLFPYTSLDPSERNLLAKSIGADVPFFLQENHCIVTGIGEILEPISVAKGYGVLAIPSHSLSTKSMYDGLQRSLQNTHDSKVWKTLTEDVIRSLRIGDWTGLSGKLENDFEKIAFQVHPDLKELKSGILQEGAVYSSLSGSGSCFFGLVAKEQDQLPLLNSLKSRFPEMDFRSFSF